MFEITEEYTPNGNQAYFQARSVEELAKIIKDRKELVKFWSDPTLRNYRWIITTK